MGYRGRGDSGRIGGVLLPDRHLRILTCAAVALFAGAAVMVASTFDALAVNAELPAAVVIPGAFTLADRELVAEGLYRRRGVLNHLHTAV